MAKDELGHEVSKHSLAALLGDLNFLLMAVGDSLMVLISVLKRSDFNFKRVCCKRWLQLDMDKRGNKETT